MEQDVEAILEEIKSELRNGNFNNSDITIYASKDKYEPDPNLLDKLIEAKYLMDVNLNAKTTSDEKHMHLILAHALLAREDITETERTTCHRVIDVCTTFAIQSLGGHSNAASISK